MTEDQILNIADEILETGAARFSGERLTIADIDEHVVEREDFLLKYYMLNETGLIDERRELLAATRVEIAQKLIGEMI